MNILQIVNRQRQPLARITWAPPNQVSLEVLSEASAADLNAFVNNAQRNGVPLRTGREVKEDGHTILVDELLTVKPEDERFLRALADAVSRHKFAGQRAFGLLRKEQK